MHGKTRREEQREFEGDVFYEVWRRGGNPDCIDYDRLQDCFDEHHEADTCAARIMEQQRPKQLEQEDLSYQEYWPDANSDVPEPTDPAGGEA